MAKRALLVGIDDYDSVRGLTGCVADATAMSEVLSRNSDGSPNFDCRVVTSEGRNRVTRAALRQHWSELFQDFDGDVLFYFSGHGAPTELGGYLVTQEGSEEDPGLPMNDVISLANRSRAKTALIILDCCHSGSVGNVGTFQAGSVDGQTQIREGITILAASRPTQAAIEIGGHGVFTNLVLGALRGGASDVRGHVSAASIYAYAEAALGGWDQRPMYKSHAARLEPVRLCDPLVADSLLREIPIFFPTADYEFQLDMTYEETNGAAIPERVTKFKKFKLLQIAGLLRPKMGSDLYWSAERSGQIVLTTLGRFYRQLAVSNRI